VAAAGSARATVEVWPAGPGVTVGCVSVAEQRHDDLTKAASSDAVQEEVDGVIDEDEQIIHGLRYLRRQQTSGIIKSPNSITLICYGPHQIH